MISPKPALAAPSVFFMILALAVSMQAQYVPADISYQGRLTDSTGSPLPDGTYDVVFYLFGDSTAVTELWNSGTKQIQVDDGLFTVRLDVADESAFLNPFDLYLGLKLGFYPIMEPLTKLTAVPYAVNARRSVDGGGWKYLAGSNLIYNQSSMTKVGIGNANPGTILAIGENIIDTPDKFVSVGSSTTGSGYICGEDQDNYGYMSWSHVSNRIFINQEDAGTHYYGLSLHEGNVGIGLSSDLPENDLVIGGNLGVTNGSNIVIKDDASSGNAGIVFGQDQNNHSRLFNWNFDDRIYLKSVVGGTEYYPLSTYQGKVHIGSDSQPSEDLVVGTDIGGYYGTRIVVGDDNEGNGAQAGYMIGENSNERCWMLWDNDGNYFSMGYRTGIFQYNNLLTMKNGHIGIKTTNPTADLHVSGSICYTGSIGTCSDLRYKSNVSSLPNALERVSRLRGVSFDWKRDDYPEHRFSGNPQIGLIAQEVIEIVPEIVSEDDNGYYNIDYSKLTPLLIEAIKQQQEQIEILTKRVEELEGK
jgi:hypothetical protein